MKNYLIVGGSRGIGKEIVNQIPENSTIHVISRSGYSGERKNVTNYLIDVTTEDFPEIDNIDHLIYCPGSIQLKPINSLKIEDFQADFDINVLGAVKAIKQYHRIIKRQKGSIVLFSTVASKIGMPFHASVAASKAAVEGLGKSLAAEFAPEIRVNVIAPTVTDTDLASHILRNEKAREATADRHPMKQFLNPSDVAALALFLTSDNAKAITGQIIGMDAGIGSIK
ncbi:MAG: SDR family oxidoreductase [Crocinitomicaceae bacterium]|nr:SDR family oxidoreductase [Crocinitomicaceae bacterium]